jgi:histidinol-phosphatase
VTALDLGAELALAFELADAADAVTMPRFRAYDLVVDRKADASEVTEADRGAEATMRALLSAARPHHAVLGEEEGLIGPPDAASRWVLDPIDGTSNFVKGVPIWATLIALQQEGEVVVGVASAPALGRRWWAARGRGAYADGQRVQVSGVSTLAGAHLAHAGVGTWFEHGRGEQFVDLSRRVWRGRGLGDFWMHCLVAEGAFDVACEPIVSLWDLAALQVIVEEAGGRFTDLDGVARPDGGSAVSTNGLLHDEVLAVLAHR